MADIVPKSVPQLKQADAQKYFKGVDKVQLIGLRGYYKDTMGEKGKNDIGIYDDAFILQTPDLYRTFNGNTDPSKYSPGVATLKAGGPYQYKVGMHNMSNPYEALRQFGNVTVTRYGKPGEFTDTPASRFYIDIHKGRFGTTSSLGCQTIHPDQWLEFMKLIKEGLLKHKQSIINYWLYEL